MNAKHAWMGIVVAVLTLAAIGAGTRSVPPDKRAKAEEVELWGRVHRPVKWSPQIDLGVGGRIRYLDLEGQLLDEIAEGTAVRVKGVVRSRFHRGGSANDPSPFGPQWIVTLELNEVEVLRDVKGTPAAIAPRDLRQQGR